MLCHVIIEEELRSEEDENITEQSVTALRLHLLCILDNKRHEILIHCSMVVYYLIIQSRKKEHDFGKSSYISVIKIFKKQNIRRNITFIYFQ